MSYLGSWKIDDLLTFPANTQVFNTGVATDADSVPTYRIYEDETTTPIVTGSMALLDSSNTAGFYSEQVTLSAANGFEKGKSYTIYIAATVSSVAGAMNHTFQIEAEVDANTVSGNVNLNLAQAVPENVVTPTVGGALNSARVQGVGKWTIAADVLTLFASDGTTVVETFALAPAGGPYTSRTP